MLSYVILSSIIKYNLFLCVESTTDNFAFDICEKEKCVNISIVNDSELEMTETFNITLERTDDLNERIILCPVNGVIAISDNGCKYSDMSQYLHNQAYAVI